jgi:hypothetical protein
MSKRGRGGAVGAKFRMSLALPVGAVMNCADNTGSPLPFTSPIWPVFRIRTLSRFVAGSQFPFSARISTPKRPKFYLEQFQKLIFDTFEAANENGRLSGIGCKSQVNIIYYWAR